MRDATQGCRSGKRRPAARTRERREPRATIAERRSAGLSVLPTPRERARSPVPRLRSAVPSWQDVARTRRAVRARPARRAASCARVHRTGRARPSSPGAEAPRPIRLGRLAASCSSSPMRQAPKRRLCAISQLSNCGLRSSSSPSRKSPANSPAKASAGWSRACRFPAGPRPRPRRRRQGNRRDRARPCRPT